MPRRYASRRRRTARLGSRPRGRQGSRSRLDAARERLDGYVREQYSELQRAGQDAPGLALPAPEAAAESASSPAEELERARLAARLTELNGERGRLLERLTAEHPLVRDVESQIADVRCALDALPPVEASSPAKLAERRRDEQLGRQWQSLVEASRTGCQQFEQECRRVELELAASEADRSAAENKFLASSGAVAAQADATRTSSAGAAPWGVFLLASGCGLAIVVFGLRAYGRAIALRDCTIRHPADIERLFHLPVVGLVAAGAAGGTLSVSQPRRGLPLAVQLIAAIIAFLLVAMTVQDPGWIRGLADHPLESLAEALGSLGGR